jgi:hypothetical protein
MQIGKYKKKHDIKRGLANEASDVLTLDAEQLP